MRIQQQFGSLQPGTGPSPELHHAHILTLKLSVSRANKNEFLFISYSAYGTLLDQPELRYLGMLPNIFKLTNHIYSTYYCYKYMYIVHII